MMIRFMVVTTLDLVKGTQFHGYIIVQVVAALEKRKVEADDNEGKVSHIEA